MVAVLSDPQKRDIYDIYGHKGLEAGSDVRCCFGCVPGDGGGVLTDAISFFFQLAVYYGTRAEVRRRRLPPHTERDGLVISWFLLAQGGNRSTATATGGGAGAHDGQRQGIPLPSFFFPSFLMRSQAPSQRVADPFWL